MDIQIQGKKLIVECILLNIFIYSKISRISLSAWFHCHRPVASKILTPSTGLVTLLTCPGHSPRPGPLQSVPPSTEFRHRWQIQIETVLTCLKQNRCTDYKFILQFMSEQSITNDSFMQSTKKSSGEAKMYKARYQELWRNWSDVPIRLQLSGTAERDWNMSVTVEETSRAPSLHDLVTKDQDGFIWDHQFTVLVV